jgi:hypothetical protein
VEPLPVVSRNKNSTESKAKRTSAEISFENRAPLRSDEKAKLLIKEALKNPIGITTEDLLNISEPARQELRALLTKKRLEKKKVSFVAEIGEATEPSELITEEVINVAKLPEATVEILEKGKLGMPKGALVVGDPVVQYLNALAPGEQPKKIIAAAESHGLRAVYPLINGVAEEESLLDEGSQIVSMAKEDAIKLDVTWDPDIIVHMQSANRALKPTLGLAKNVPFLFGRITVYLQVHIMEEPAYKVLLGRPFHVITASLIKNERDGSQTLTLTDPNSGERCVMQTYERGQPVKILKRSKQQDFPTSRNW